MTPAITESRLPYLFEAVQCGTVRAAADRLDIAPSAVSRQIALLEAELALPLIERHKRGVHLTQAGRLLMEYYREQRAHQEDLLAKLQEVRGLRRGHIRLAVGEGFVSDLMGAPLQYFCKRYPDITLTLDLAGTNEVMRLVAEDDADIGLVYNPPAEPKIVSRAQMRQPVHAIVAPDSSLMDRLDKTGSLQLDALYNVPLALMHGAYGTRQLMALAEQSEKHRLTPTVTTNSISVLKHFVRAGLGATFLPTFAVSQEIEAGVLCALPVDHPILKGAEAHLVTRAGRRLSGAANRLLTHLASKMEAFGAPD
ncbi:LysR family transcriptional regulator [Pandoraea apista]|uniref:LysR family transcriptional regulator n=1 Tax=Pandoraea apista TaxID=93218 RepID=A0ABX9ZP90_9BURK|nr:LysR family transcriptional regulator [Pandoraea apista]AJE97114.1 LysR family transcriptional regulator [Pandoraea apista]AKH71068.1 LysR family transcriptional regulator [Pandoraea apista]AKI63339.1 LysR family transcriptional regulator [Pandoraea apista]ALS67559.1 LysR family transcriptional regulator [Pandoraea apista]AVF41704.1 LysR family transcriptional regulator [Pandoraea apista]